ncbi:MAG TPA: glycosyltransferase family 2 protein [Vicinamibacterales bacterium]|nr:glycosyltransferase family 2 protein [Vicinamibacterales bacterium]
MSPIDLHRFLALVFWLGVCGTLYSYVLFPALAAVLARRHRSTLRHDDREPELAVTLIIPAYNEERSIGARIHNALEADYPRALFEIIVVSDASTDATDEIVRSFRDPRVRLLVQPARRGKTAGLNEAVRAARGEIVVFTDANAAYPRGTIRRLAQYFRQPAIGLVTGYTRYALNGTGAVSETSNVYTSIERVIKKAESAWGCCVGADGAIFAIRRALYMPLRADDINDFVIPLSIAERGYRCVLAEDVFCSEGSSHSLDSEFRRQSRITNRTLRALWRNARLLNPLRFPRLSFFLFSHKVLRFGVPVFLVMSGVSLALLAPREPLYFAAAGAVLCGGAGVLFARNRPGSLLALDHPWLKPLRMTHVFLTVNAAMLHGWWRFLSGQGDVTWQHDRSAA